MAAAIGSFRPSRRGIRLTLSGCAVIGVLVPPWWLTGALWQAHERRDELRASRAALDVGMKTSPERSDVLRSTSTGPDGQRLVAPDKATAIALIQQVFQRTVAPPAKLESLQILDGPDDQGLIVVRASIRIRDLAPDRVASFVRTIEATVPAIVFDTIRISVRSGPGAMGMSRSDPTAETWSADISGVVDVYAMRATGRSSPAPSGEEP